MRWHISSILALSLVTTACGGGGGSGSSSTPAPAPIQDVVAPSVPAASGSVQSTGSSSVNTAVSPGDNGLDHGSRGHVVYDLSALPAGATILSATLHIEQSNSVGSPFPAFGVVVVDHVSALSYSSDVLALDVGVLATDDMMTMRTLDVTSEVAADLAASRTTSQFRLRFNGLETNNDQMQDVVRFAVDSRIEIRFQ